MLRIRLRVLLLTLLAPLAAGAATPVDPEPPRFETKVKQRKPRRDAPAGRATSVVTKADMDKRLPRSAPDALRWEPGVFVQQTAHGQGSAFIRGMTGQQTLLLFDGIRLNNSTYRQGPNQYFFTLDARTIDTIEVMRGGGSTRFGSDALGGVIDAHPLEPPLAEDGPAAHVQVQSRAATADKERGGRVQFQATNGDNVSLVGGVGARRVGQLESAGQVNGLHGGSPARVPRLAPDGRTQLGTGFDEVTGDARAVFNLGPRQSVTTAAYIYREYNAPRTDQCPPAFAPSSECLKYDQQFRTLAYAAYDARLTDAGDTARVTFSWQQQHERRSTNRPSSFVKIVGVDTVDTMGVTARVGGALRPVAPALALRLTAGGDTYFDRIRSRAWMTFTDIDVTVPRGRGQYLDGSTYLYGGAFADLDVDVLERFTLRSGARASWIGASAPADPESGSRGVNRAWTPLVGHLGAEWRVAPPLTLFVNLDNSFRAPNLDDMTSRQRTGPGFQFENADLQPERATTLEAGLLARLGRVEASAWAFRTRLDGAVGKKSRTAEDCPPETPECRNAWNQYQLVNATRPAELRGAEGSVRARLPLYLVFRSTLSWTVGNGPNLSDRPSDPNAPYQERVPLSRVPPPNGTLELDEVHPSGLGLGVAVRWAAAQDRLAIADQNDSRIPVGGTPGFVVADARASYRLGNRFAVSAVVENLLDTPYRYHGSSVNGPGRGLIVSVEGTPF